MKEKSKISHWRKRKNDNEAPIQALALETFKKFDVNLEKIKNEVSVLKFEMVDYEEKLNSSVFGEKESISYLLHFKTYNIEFEVKLLTFEYETKSEVVKLDIDCKTPSVNKEIKYCCNSLQRRRNLNLTFITLISFARYFESRRLICDVILKRSRNVKIEENKDGGKIVVYRDQRRNIKLGVFWSVECNSEHNVIDKVEIYYKVAELPNRSDIKNILTQLTEPHLEFNEKLHLWENLLKSLCEDQCNNVTCTNSDEISLLKYSQLIPDRDNLVKKEEPDDEDDDDVFVISSSPIKTVSQVEVNPLVCVKNSNLLSKNSKEASILLSDNDDVEEQNISKSNDKSHQIIYLDSLDDDITNEACSSTTSHNESNISRKQNEPTSACEKSANIPCVDVTDTDNEDKEVSNISRKQNEPTSAREESANIPCVDVTDTDNEDKEVSNISRKQNEPTSACGKSTNIPCVDVTDTDNEDKEVVCSYKINNSIKTCNSSKLLREDCPTIIELDLILPPKKPKIVDDDLEITGITYLVPD